MITITYNRPDLPPVKPSAIAMGTIFTHTASLGILAPVFGDTYHRAQAANSKEEFVKSKEAAGAAAAWGSSLVGSAVQTYGVAALINATGTLSYKGAAYLGSLIFMASSAPSVSISDLLPRLSHEVLTLRSVSSSSAKSSRKSDPSILLLLVLSAECLRQSGLVCSLPGGVHVQILLIRSESWFMVREMIIFL
jgi:hypothetical protein